MHTKETIANVNGIEIAYDTFGDRTCPPMVLIMGLSSQMVMWEDDFCTRLAERGYWVVRFDNRDVGRSTKLDVLGVPDFKSLFSGGGLSAVYTLDDMARDTVGLLDVLGIGSANIVGVSMGGMIAQLLAVDHAPRVRTVAIIMSTTGSPHLPPPKPEALRVLFRPFPLEEKAYVDYYIEMMGVLNGGVMPVDQVQVEELARLTYERGVSPAGSARQFAAVFSSGSRKERLASVRVPALVIHGDADPLVPVECGIDVAGSIPGAELMIIPGMGHVLSPAAWDEVIDALDRHARSSLSDHEGRATYAE